MPVGIEPTLTDRSRQSKAVPVANWTSVNTCCKEFLGNGWDCKCAFISFTSRHHQAADAYDNVSKKVKVVPRDGNAPSSCLWKRPMYLSTPSRHEIGCPPWLRSTLIWLTVRGTRQNTRGQEKWRKGWDLNSRRFLGLNSFQDCRHKPLAHPSKMVGPRRIERLTVCSQSICSTKLSYGPIKDLHHTYRNYDHWLDGILLLLSVSDLAAKRVSAAVRILKLWARLDLHLYPK